MSEGSGQPIKHLQPAWMRSRAFGEGLRNRLMKGHSRLRAKVLESYRYNSFSRPFGVHTHLDGLDEIAFLVGDRHDHHDPFRGRDVKVDPFGPTFISVRGGDAGVESSTLPKIESLEPNGAPIGGKPLDEVVGIGPRLEH